MDAIKAEARKLTNDQLTAAARELTKGHLSEDKRMVRAAVIDVYGERAGWDAADKLMDELGM
jgi:hypothetical protein